MGLGALLTATFSLHCDHSKLGSIIRCQSFPGLLPSVVLSTAGMALPALGIGNGSSYSREMSSSVWKELPGKESLFYTLYDMDHILGIHGQYDPSSLCPEDPMLPGGCCLHSGSSVGRG